jgi:hypothetical protein
LSSSQEGPQYIGSLEDILREKVDIISGSLWASMQDVRSHACFNKPARWFPSFPSELGAMSWTMSGGGYQASVHRGEANSWRHTYSI